MSNIFSSVVIILGYIWGMYTARITHVPPNIIDFFPNIKDNLTRVSWAHAVNNKSYLNDVLEQGDIMMIEADVILGRLIDDPRGTLQPVMGHPPKVESDLSLSEFLNEINEFNLNAETGMKGVKLDFKSIEVFEQSLETVDSLYNKVLYPVWINADILAGPVESDVKPVDATRFLNACKKYSAAMLSIGWTTRYGGLITEGTYTDAQIMNMLNALNSIDIQQPVTFPVRAGIAAESYSQLRELLELSTNLNSTLTIWSSVGDSVNIEKLRTLILDCGLNKIYLDVPTELYDQLHL